MACFVGTVRDLNEGQTVQAMELEHYPGMTEKALEAIAAQARERWPGSDVLIVHRVGKLLPFDQIALVVTTAMHRAQAFESCAFVMDSSQDAGAVLEEGKDRTRRKMGRRS